MAIDEPMAPMRLIGLRKTRQVATMMAMRLTVLQMEWVMGATWLRVMKAISLYR